MKLYFGNTVTAVTTIMIFVLLVLLSTHIVSDIEKAADRILVIKDGQKVFDGTEEETGKDLETFYLEIFGGEE